MPARNATAGNGASRMGPLILVTDRSHLVPILRGSAPDVRVWAASTSVKEADAALADALAAAPDLKRDVVFLIDVAPRRVARIAANLTALYPRAAVILDRRSAGGEARHDTYFVVDTEHWLADWLAAPRDLAAVRARAEQLKRILEPRKQVLILTHPNPDPDAIASALGMRTVLGRNRQTATIGYLGRKLTRPENVAMVELLELDLVRLEPAQLDTFDAIILVDCQENLFSGFELPKITAVIDHHPERPDFEVPFREVIPEEGATSTIITRYLQALQIEPSQRLATALLYGVKTDTFFLKREVNIDDITSFLYLYPRANLNILRRMEVPELPLKGMQALGRALANAKVEAGVFYCGLAADPAIGEDGVARLAELGLQVRDVQWSIAWAQIGDDIVLSARNVGYVRHAGRALEQAFGAFGPAGGHRSAARAILGAQELAAKLGSDWPNKLEAWIAERIADVVTTGDEPSART